MMFVLVTDIAAGLVIFLPAVTVTVPVPARNSKPAGADKTIVTPVCTVKSAMLLSTMTILLMDVNAPGVLLRHNPEAGVTITAARLWLIQTESNPIINNCTIGINRYINWAEFGQITKIQVMYTRLI